MTQTSSHHSIGFHFSSDLSYLTLKGADGTSLILMITLGTIETEAAIIAWCNAASAEKGLWK